MIKTMTLKIKKKKNTVELENDIKFSIVFFL